MLKAMGVMVTAMVVMATAMAVMELVDTHTKRQGLAATKVV